MANIYTGSNTGKAGLEVTEVDGVPDVFGVSKIIVSNGTLTDDGAGTVTITTGGGGGGVTTLSMGTTGLTPAAITAGAITVAGTLVVANGGTGAITLADGGILLGSGTGAITATAQPTNGQLLIGSTGADPVLATLASAGATVTITNTAGGINLEAAASGGVITATANGLDNRITTYSAATTLNGEANLTFDGIDLLVTGNLTVTDNAGFGTDGLSTLGFYGEPPIPQGIVGGVGTITAPDGTGGGNQTSINDIIAILTDYEVSFSAAFGGNGLIRYI